jgi:hypothetical protein
MVRVMDVSRGGPEEGSAANSEPCPGQAAVGGPPDPVRQDGDPLGVVQPPREHLDSFERHRLQRGRAIQSSPSSE